MTLTLLSGFYSGINQNAETILCAVNKLNELFTAACSVSGVEYGCFSTETESIFVYIVSIIAYKS